MYQLSLLDDPDCYSPAFFTSASGGPLEIDPETDKPFPHPFAAALNHWFYLLAEGSNPAGGPASPTCDGSTLTGLGIRLAGKIFYNGLLLKTPTWTYQDARAATLTATKEMFSDSCIVFDNVKAAWNAVSVPALPDEPTCGVPTPTPTPTAPAPLSSAPAPLP